jgi:hypothetical protein
MTFIQNNVIYIYFLIFYELIIKPLKPNLGRFLTRKVIYFFTNL